MMALEHGHDGRTWGQLSQRERVERELVVSHLLVDHGRMIVGEHAEQWFNTLYRNAVMEIDPTDGWWHWRVAAWIAARF